MSKAFRYIAVALASFALGWLAGIDIEQVASPLTEIHIVRVGVISPE